MLERNMLFERKPKAIDFVKASAEVWDVSVAEMTAEFKDDGLVVARQTAIYLIRTVLGKGFNIIGRLLNRDHSTIIYHYEVARSKIKNDEYFAVQTWRAHDLAYEMTNGVNHE